MRVLGAALRLACRLTGRAGMNGERMDRTGQFVGQNFMYGEMPFDPAFALKGRRNYIDT